MEFKGKRKKEINFGATCYVAACVLSVPDNPVFLFKAEPKKKTLAAGVDSVLFFIFFPP